MKGGVFRAITFFFLHFLALPKPKYGCSPRRVQKKTKKKNTSCSQFLLLVDHFKTQAVVYNRAFFLGGGGAQSPNLFFLLLTKPNYREST